jgi:hypothetical protein
VAPRKRALEPDQLLCDLLALDPGLRLVPGAAPLGTIRGRYAQHPAARSSKPE